jgi:hypothetical protein
VSNLPAVQKLNLPAHLKPLQGAPDGFLADDSAIMQPPRIKLIAPMSAEAQDGKAKPGDFWSQARDRVLTQPIKFIPLQEGLEWLKFNEDMQVEWRTTSEKEADSLARMGGQKGSWEFKNLNLLVLIEGVPEIITFRGAGFGAGAAFHRQAKGLGVPLYAQGWELSSTALTGKKGKYWVPVCAFRDFVGEDDLVMSQTFFEKFKAVFEQRQEEPSTEVEKPKDDPGVPF